MTLFCLPVTIRLMISRSRWVRVAMRALARKMAGLVAQLRPAPVDRGADDFQEAAMVERLLDEIEGAAFHRVHRDRHVAVPGHEHDGG